MKNRLQKTDNRQRRMNLYFSVCVLCSVLCVLSLLILPSVVEASQDIRDVLKAYLNDNYPWEEIRINDLKLSGEISGELPERILVAKGPPNRTVFNLEFKNGRKITASAVVKAFDRIVKSRKAFRKGYVFRKDDLYVTMMDVTRIPTGAVKGSDQVIGRQLARSIIVNMPIVDKMLVESPVVKRGQKVVLLVESPSISITTIGKIKENCHVGDYVKVLNLGSKKVVTGLLLDENTVKVEF